MRFLVALGIVFAGGYAFSMAPIVNDYKDDQNTYTEFKNVFDNGQDKSFTKVVQSTPNVVDMRDGEIFIYISTLTAPVIKLMIRSGTTVYASSDFNIIKAR